MFIRTKRSRLFKSRALKMWQTHELELLDQDMLFPPFWLGYSTQTQKFNITHTNMLITQTKELRRGNNLCCSHALGEEVSLIQSVFSKMRHVVLC